MKVSLGFIFFYEFDGFSISLLCWRGNHFYLIVSRIAATLSNKGETYWFHHWDERGIHGSALATIAVEKKPGLVLGFKKREHSEQGLSNTQRQYPQP